jgi:hypothetical protein
LQNASEASKEYIDGRIGDVSGTVADLIEWLAKRDVFYGESSTAAGTQEKVATLEDSVGFSLSKGVKIRIKFSNAQSYNGQPTLNVNGTGAVGIMRNGTSVGVRYMWSSGEVLDFLYDGSNWVALDGGIATTTYYGPTKLSSSTSSTSEAMAATPKAVKAAYDLAASVVQKVDLSIPTSAWTNDATVNSDYPYYADVTVSIATADSGSETIISFASLSVARDCGMCCVAETLAGKVRYYAATKPSSEISGIIKIINVKTT